MNFTKYFSATVLFFLLSLIAVGQDTDPYAPYREINATSAPSQANEGIAFENPFGPMIAPGASKDVTLGISASFVPPVENQPGMLQITAEIPEGWYTYSITQPAGGPTRTLLHLPSTIKPTRDISITPAPTVKNEPGIWDVPVESHTGTVTWQIPFVWTNAKHIGAEISGSVEAQLCNADCCLEPKKVPFSAKPAASFPGKSLEKPAATPAPTPAVGPVSAAAEAPAVAETANAAPAVQNIPPTAVTATENVPETAQKTTQKTAQTTEAEIKPASAPSTLGFWLLGAYLGGLILNLMPCVLPVIAPKLYSFMHQAGESRWRIFQLNFTYVLGLMTVLWLLAGCSRIGDLMRGLAKVLPEDWAARLPLAQNMGWGEQYTYPGFVIFMISLVFVMGLSFLGTWEIPIPGFVAGGSIGKAQRKEGLFGAYCMGILTTILATPCVGPFLGPVFGAVMSEPIGVSFLVFTVIGLGLATPYLLVGLCPSWVKFLPKPGAWMETLKEVMAFFFFAVVVWQFYVLPAEYTVPTLVLLVALWFACWLIGKVTFSGAAPDKILTAWVCAVAFVAMTGFGFFHLWFAEHKIEWQTFSPQLVEQLKAEYHVVMIDFTANWCFTCKTNTLTAIEKQDVAEFLHRNKIVPVLADWSNRSDEIRNYLQALNRNSIPLIVIWIPGQTEPVLLDGLITENQLLDALEQAMLKNKK